MSNIQYLTIENCKSQNEIQIFEIMEYYTAVFTGDRATSDIAARANEIRNEAAAILNSSLEGDSLALLQSKFLSKFNEWYKIGEIEYSTSFDFFLKNQISTVRTQGSILFCSNLEAKRFHTAQERTTTKMEILLICRTIHNDILTGKYGNGKFVQG